MLSHPRRGFNKKCSREGFLSFPRSWTLSQRKNRSTVSAFIFGKFLIISLRVDKKFCYLLLSFEVEGEKWRILRQKMTTTFSSGKIKGMMPLLTKISQEFIDVIDESVVAKKSLNYRDFTSRFMCEIIGQVAFGLECKFNYKII